MVVVVVEGEEGADSRLYYGELGGGNGAVLRGGAGEVLREDSNVAAAGEGGEGEGAGFSHLERYQYYNQ